MEIVRVGIREFRDKLATYVLESEAPVAITRHGLTVGHYVPVQKKRPTQEQWETFRIAREAFQKQLAAAGIDEEAYLADFEEWRRRQQEPAFRKPDAA